MKALVALLALACAGDAQAAGADALDRLGEAIAGRWTSSVDGAAGVRIDYTAISRGSALTEAWQPGTPGETLSVFHRDGARVLATHYCAQGNQPRLALREGQGFVFEFVDATNLADASRSHLHRLELVPNADGSLDRIETYREQGRDETSRLHLVRVAGTR